MHEDKIEVMLGMLGGGENMSENLSGCVFTLGISLHKGIVEGGDTTYLSQRWEVSSRCASQCSSTQTAELVVILMACSGFCSWSVSNMTIRYLIPPQLFLSMENFE